MLIGEYGMHDVNYNNIYEAGRVIVALDTKLSLSSGWNDVISLALDGIEYEKAEIIFHSNKSKQEEGAGDILLVYLKNKDYFSVMDAIEKLSANPYVLYAEPDYEEELHLISNDPLYGQLWGTQRIEAPLAWEYTTGSPEITVGVIDSGIDYNHPDIRRNMWISPGGNLQNGWNFADNNRYSTDINGHGTHVAGTIGAVGNNYIGITGICWDIRVASLRFGLNTSSAIAAIDFADYLEFPILNASWGGHYYSRSLKYAIEQYNGLFIASAGNYGTDNDIYPVYPASYDSDNIISVAATDRNDILAGFSNYGARSVDIAAPGTGILSLGLYGSYSPRSGTSMSAPHVAGAAALLKSYLPDLTALEMKNIILESAVFRPGLAGRVLTGGLLDVNAMFERAVLKL